MRVNVRLFGFLRDRAGRSCMALEMEPGATVAQVVAGVAQEVGLDARLLSYVRSAVNHEYCDESQAVAEGDEVALIPPVSGG